MKNNEKANRFGNSVITLIRGNALIFRAVGKKLRTPNQIVELSALSNCEYQVINTSQQIKASALKSFMYDEQQSIIRLAEGREDDKLLLDKFSFRAQKKRCRMICLSSVTTPKRRITTGAISE